MPEGRLDDDERDRIRADFEDAVNMPPADLDRWLATEESQAVGAPKDGGGESVGHESGRRIVAIKRKKKADLDDEDYAHMKKVVGYVHRHLAQGGPEEGAERSRWRYSLMNWGCDPLKRG